MKVKDYNMSRKPDIEFDGKLYEFDSLTELGINFPFQLYVPNEIRDNCDLIVTGRTPGENNSLTLKESIESAKKKNFSYSSRGLSFKYQNPMLLPVIPRYYGIQSTSLGYLSYHNDYHETEARIDNHTLNLTKDELALFDNLDGQIAKMIAYSKDFIRSKGIIIDDKVIMTGYSAASKLASRFSILHPDLVKGVIAGGFGGLTILPIGEYNNWRCDYPLGINDIPDFDMEKFAKIKQFYYIGSEDYNDSSIPHCQMQVDHIDEKGNKIYAKDEDGNTIPLRDEDNNLLLILDENENMTAEYGEGYYSNYQINAINKGISLDVQERFDIMKKIYEYLGIDATFIKYPGNHITVNDNDILYDDIFQFYEENLKNNKTL